MGIEQGLGRLTHAMRILCIPFLTLLLPGPTQGKDSLEALKSLSLDELSDLEISIVSKRPERLADSTAAVYVLTADDIRRSGYTSIPELLRLVPGFNVARIDGSEWAITSRGFNSRFANKLLVMIDGRSVYTPLFSGVFWETFDTLLEDIKRIEVIRGPGASTWGANAVNGVVNIITRHAADTQGALASGYAGNQQRGLAGRYGTAVGETGYLRLYAKHSERDAQIRLNDSRDDDEYRGQRIGLRSDWDLSAGDTLMVQGELFDENPDDPWIEGGNLMLEWDHDRASGARDSLQVYYDRFDLRTGDQEGALNEKLDTLDLEYRLQFSPMGAHDLNGGLGYRWHKSAITGSLQNSAEPPKRSFQRFSAFIQDEIRLVDRRWYLTLGTKLEHNDFTGFELQPSVRTRWHPRPDSTIWAAISRAVRTPSRAEHDLTAEIELAPASPQTLGLPLRARSAGDTSMVSEELIAYELGLRWKPAPSLGLDLTAFYNDYDKLRTLEISSPQVELSPAPHLLISAASANLMQGQTYGLEWVADWRPSRHWRLQAWYSLLKTNLNQAAQSTDPDAENLSGQSPQQQLGLRLGFDLSHDWELDLFARYVDQLPDFDVDAYAELDARLGWQVNRHLNLSLVGRNLLNPSHQEYGRENVGTRPHKIEREMFLRAELRY